MPDGKDYPPDFFIISRCNAKGQTDRFYGDTWPEWMAQIREVVKDPDYPWRSVAEFIRFAIFWALKFARSLKPKPGGLNIIEHMEAANMEVFRSQVNRGLEDTVDRVEKEVQELVQSGHGSQAVGLVQRLRHKMSKVEDDYWREAMLKKIERRMGWVLDES